MFSQWRHQTLKITSSSEFWASFVQRFQTSFFIAWAVKKQAMFQNNTQLRSSCRWYGRAAQENTTSRILSTGIVVQGTWLMLRSICLFFHFCWLQITVLKVSSIIILVDSDALWSHNWWSKAHTNNEQPISLAKCFCFKKLKIDYSA